MDSLFLVNFTNLPFFNNVAILVIDFVVIVLLTTVFNHNKFKDAQSKNFALMGVFMFLWVNFAHLARIVGQNSIVLSELFLRIAWVATPLLFYTTYQTSMLVIKKLNHQKVSLLLKYLAIGLSVLTMFTNLIIKSVGFVGVDLDIVYGDGFIPFLVAISTFMFYTLVPLIRVKTSRGVQGFIWGVVVFYFANLIFNIFLPAFMNITHLYYLGDYSTIFLLGMTAYAIIRHKLFDVKVITSELLTLLLWTVLLLKIIFADDFRERAIDFGILVFAVIFGLLLIRSVIREVEQKEKLERLTLKLKALDKQKDEFINMAAHELRAPMTAIKGYVSMIMEGDAGEITEKARGYLTDVATVNDRLVRLVNNMLNVSRIEEGRLVYKTEVVSLHDIAKSVHTSFKFEAERKGLGFLLHEPKNVKDLVEVDPDRLTEIIGNFVSNAVKYTETGSIEINITQPKKGRIRLGIKDTGPGISKPEQKKLFQKFYRVESTAGKTIGTGLGLYISKLLVHKFHGEMGLISDAGKGSEFWFDLPVTMKKKPNTLTK